MHRESLPDAVRRPLYFARVWEDPILELEAFAPQPDRRYVIVGSAACTVLSLLAGGARQVTAVDINPTQNNLGELKAALVLHCDPDEALTFLGHVPASSAARRAIYRRVRHELSAQARAAWDQRIGAIGAGVERSGTTERLTRWIALATRVFVHPRHRIEEMLAQPTLAAQRDFYARVWDTPRWRTLLRVLGNRHLFKLAYAPAGLHHDQSFDPAAYYARVFEHAVTAVPVANNYFLHQVFLGRYPRMQPDGLPPYLALATLERLRASLGSLAFVDGSYTAHLRRCPPRSIDGFALSNICEWMTPVAVDELFAEIVRTARPDAIVCFRNNFGHTDVPAAWQQRVVEDRARSAEMSRRDRSIVTPRFAVCHVTEAPAQHRSTSQRASVPVERAAPGPGRRGRDGLRSACDAPCSD